MHKLLFALLLAASTANAPSASAERYEVKMLNRSEAGGLVYEPDFLHIQPSDTVKFLATDSSHNAASIPEMLPQNARPFKGQINQEIEVTFDVVGRYGIRCIPHYGMGMVMLVQVGNASPDAELLPVDLPPEARQRFEAILQQHKAM